MFATIIKVDSPTRKPFILNNIINVSVRRRPTPETCVPPKYFVFVDILAVDTKTRLIKNYSYDTSRFDIRFQEAPVPAYTSFYPTPDYTIPFPLKNKNTSIREFDKKDSASIPNDPLDGPCTLSSDCETSD